MPKISVLMAVFNCERYLPQAIDSILNQTYSDFEFVIVNDGSTDSTSEVLTRYAIRDQRITVIQNKENVGLAQSLNRGLEIARGEFIARMDADDVSLPERLALQLAFMEQNPEIGVLGTNITYIDVDGRPINGGRPKDVRPASPDLIRWMLLWRTPIYHPTVLVRQSVLAQTENLYDPRYDPSDDRDLWTRLSRHTEMTRMPQVTVQYRVVPTSLSRARTKEKRTATHAITRRMLTTLLGIKTTNEALETLISVFSNYHQSRVRDFVAASDTLLEVYRCFCDQPLSVADREQIRADVADRLIAVAREASRYSSKMAFEVLWRMRYLPSLHLYSVKTAIRILKVVLNSFGIRGHARLSNYPRTSVDLQDE